MRRRPYAFLAFEVIRDSPGLVRLGLVPSKTKLHAGISAKRRWPGHVVEVKRLGTRRDSNGRYSYEVHGPAPNRVYLDQVMAADKTDALWLASQRWPDAKIEVESRLSYDMGGVGRPAIAQ